VAVCVKDGGRRAIHLPGPREVSDLYTGAEVAKGASAFEADFADRATRVFRLR